MWYELLEAAKQKEAVAAKVKGRQARARRVAAG
jgi:hypothetical protein